MTETLSTFWSAGLRDVALNLLADVIVVWCLGPWLFDRVTEARRLKAWAAQSLRCRQAVRVLLIQLQGTLSYTLQHPAAAEFRAWAAELQGILRRRLSAEHGAPPELLRQAEMYMVRGLTKTAGVHQHAADQLVFLLGLFDVALPAPTRAAMIDAAMAARECAVKLRKEYDFADDSYLAAQIEDYLECTHRACLSYGALADELNVRVDRPIP